MTVKPEHAGWIVRESGPPGADHTALLLPGALCTALFYDDVLADSTLTGASIRFVVTTLQGYGSTPAPDDLSIENYARLGGRLARAFGCDVVVGHSLGANVAIEMACAGEFAGRLVLLAPSFSREDESSAVRAVDRMGRVFGHLPHAALLKLIGQAMRSALPPERRDALVAEMKKTDPRFMRRSLRHYFDYLDEHGSLARRLCDSGARAGVVFGDRDDVGLTDAERCVLEECREITLVTIADAGHFTLNERPGKIAELILRASV